MQATPLSKLLDNIKWPDASQKGIAVWQGRNQGDKIPPTVNIVLTPNTLKAKVFNIVATDKPQPHLTVEFTLDGANRTPILTEWRDAGGTVLTGTPEEQCQEAARQISAFITLVGGTPRVDYLGKLFKDAPKKAPGA